MPKTIFTGANRTVVEMLRRERLRADLTQAQLAERLNKDQSWVSLVEGSQRRVDIVEFIQIAHALDVDPCVLLREIEDKLP